MKKTWVFLATTGVILGVLIALVHTRTFKPQIYELGWGFIYYLGYQILVFLWILGIYLALAVKVWLQKFENLLENKILIMTNAGIFVLALLNFYQLFFGGVGIWGANKGEPNIFGSFYEFLMFLLATVVISLISLVIFVWKHIQRIKN